MLDSKINDPLPQSLRRMSDRFLRHILIENDKLIPSISRTEYHIILHQLKLLCDPLNALIPCLMSVVIIILLKIIAMASGF